MRVACGDWRRVLGPSVTEKLGVTGILLDPPYSISDRAEVYAEEDFEVAHAVREWAIQNGDNHMLRIAVCGYEGEHDMPTGWEVAYWKANGGYGSQRRGGSNENARRERIWFSPHCLAVDVQPDLFE